MSTRERTAKFRAKKKAEPDYDSEGERKLTRDRVREIRRKAAAKEEQLRGRQLIRSKSERCTSENPRTCKDLNCKFHPERDRKRKYRFDKASVQHIEKHGCSNLSTGAKRRRARLESDMKEKQLLRVQVKQLTNANRRLKRRTVNVATTSSPIASINTT